MPDYHFIAQSPLHGYNKDFAGVTIAEIVGISITSIGIPAGGQTELKAALLEIFNIRIPEMGAFTTSGLANSYLLGLQDNQLFLVSEKPVSKSAIDRLKPNAYLTDQSDSWVTLSVSGEKCREMLARICPVDLHPAQFPAGKVLRILMAHLGVIIYRPNDDCFCLLAPSSAAGSFLQALEAAATSICTITGR
ncbi:MAG: hypothetical protein L3J37_09510 [Rhodobacteraceae bacterium]|nr:hypothetical protein [Paracoccaceae bacterium]